MQLLREIIGLPPNLPPCLGVTRHMSSLIWFPEMKERQFWLYSLCEYGFEVTGDENDIPNWFNHQRDGNLISFTIGPEFPTIAVCTAFGIQDSYCELCHYRDYTPFKKQDCEAFHGFDRSFDYHVIISINGTERRFERKSIRKDKRSGHLTFSCRPQSSLQELFRDLQLKDRNHVEILCETVPHSSVEDFPPPQRIGVHVECNCPPPQNPSIIQDINRPLSLQSGLGLPMDTENGSDLGSALDSSNVDGFDLGSSSVAQPPVNDDFDSNQFPLCGRMGRLLIRLFVVLFFYLFILFLTFK